MVLRSGRAVTVLLVAHRHAGVIGVYLACGNIGGHMVEGSFVVGLGPVGTSGYSGIAWLTDLGDDSTEVRVAITASGAATRMDDDDDDGDDDDWPAPIRSLTRSGPPCHMALVEPAAAVEVRPCALTLAASTST